MMKEKKPGKHAFSPARVVVSSQRVAIFFVCIFLITAALPMHAQTRLLDRLLKHHPQYFQAVLERPGLYDIQIIYTQIDRDESNFPSFRTYTYQLDEKQYFYPASTVKMPTAFLALEKLNNLRIEGLDKHSAMLTGAGSAPQTAVSADTTSASGLPSVAHYIKKVFLVSDNDAHNRLYEFLGQQQLNEALWAKGYLNTRIVHRLGIAGFDEETNRYTNPVSFFEGEKLLYHQGEVEGRMNKDFSLTKTRRGAGYYEGDKLINEPFDFSRKNYVSLQDFHDMLKAVIFPEAVPPSRRFNLTEDDYRFLYQVMSEKPGESRFPAYQKPDHYVKFFMFGDQPDTSTMPESVRIFNKVGWAYGFLTDVAYIVDFDAGIEFFLAATIHVNEDGIFNDDQYAYETVGLPFLSNLGKVVYEYEKQRKRKRKPGLSKFIVSQYD